MRSIAAEMKIVEEITKKTDQDDLGAKILIRAWNWKDVTAIKLLNRLNV